MSRRLPSHGVVSLPALDLRAEPDHKSELTSQLLLGEVVRVLGGSRDGRWWRVENRDDRDRGWIRTWGVVGASAAAAGQWERRARARVVVSHAELRGPGGTTRVSPLFFRGRLIVGRARDGLLPAQLPDGRRGWVEAGALATGARARRGLADRIRVLLGAPYLWGGRTPMGIDCSAFTQLVLAEQGVAIPRDADEQHRACDPISTEDARPGDLYFFRAGRGPIGHVALALGGGAYAHARGWVRINSLVPGNPLHDKELHGQFQAAGRPRRGARWTARRGRRPPESA